MSAQQEEIQHLAYRLWQEAGGPHGRDWDFWLQAEAQLESVAKPKPVKAKTPAKPKAAPKAPAKAKAAAKA